MLDPVRQKRAKVLVVVQPIVHFLTGLAKAVSRKHQKDRERNAWSHKTNVSQPKTDKASSLPEGSFKTGTGYV